MTYVGCLSARSVNRTAGRLNPALDGFSVTSERLGEVAVVRVAGELDMLTAPGVEAAVQDVLRSNATALVLDYVEVTFIDSTAMRLLWDVRNRMTRERRRFALVCGEPRVLRTLQLTGLTVALRVSRTFDDALASVA
jgi:anti-sigma B factor antagonist